MGDVADRYAELRGAGLLHTTPRISTPKEPKAPKVPVPTVPVPGAPLPGTVPAAPAPMDSGGAMPWGDTIMQGMNPIITSAFRHLFSNPQIAAFAQKTPVPVLSFNGAATKDNPIGYTENTWNWWTQGAAPTPVTPEKKKK